MKPCPFCGGKAVRIKKVLSLFSIYYEQTDIIRSKDTGYIKCSKCGIRQTKESTFKTAEKRWNNRKDGEQE